MSVQHTSYLSRKSLKGSEKASLPRKQSSIFNQRPFQTTLQRARVYPQSLTPTDVLQLQRTIGNTAVSKLLKGKKDVAASTFYRKGDDSHEPVGTGSAGQAPTPESIIEVGIQRARKTGSALSSPIHRRLENAFSVDFSRVRIHTDSAADNLNRLLESRAFTFGSDVFFRQGEYRPESPDGQKVLAHELTHVLQQTGGVQQKLVIGQSDDQYEREADKISARIVERLSGNQRDVSVGRGTKVSITHTGLVQRIQRFDFKDNPLYNGGYIVGGPYSDLADQKNEADAAVGAAFGSRATFIKAANRSLHGISWPPDKVAPVVAFVANKSDVTDGALTDLTTMGDFLPEVDHIIPKSKGGSNSYRNAAVLSRWENGKLKRDDHPWKTALDKGWLRKASEDELKAENQKLQVSLQQQESNKQLVQDFFKKGGFGFPLGNK